jgi:peptidoglycan/xylan/chitin deacetylase (PgdA/CDA1 family)
MVPPGLKSLMRSTLSGFGVRLPFILLARTVPRDVIVLMYHAVGDTPAPYLRNLYPHKTPSQFEEDLILLKREFVLPTWEEFVANRTRSRPLKRPSVLITFDDGLSDCYRSVRPLLLKHDIPCLFFVTKAFVDNRTMFFRHKASLCIEGFGKLSSSNRNSFVNAAKANGLNCPIEQTDFASWILGLDHKHTPVIDRACDLLGVDIDDFLQTNRPYMTRGEIAQLHADGFTIGGHSITHPLLRSLSREAIELEIIESCRFVRDLLKVEDVPFAFPFSADGVSRPILRVIAQRDPWISVMFGSNGIDPDEPFLLNRINVDQPPAETDRSNVLHLIKQSYADALLHSLRQTFGTR